MTLNDQGSTDMITSVELLKLTGLSRATLNNYIKAGLLPKPLVKKPHDPGMRAKQVGYFPASVIQLMSRIYTLKKEGRTIPEIIAELGNRDGVGTDAPRPQNTDENRNELPWSDHTVFRKNCLPSASRPSIGAYRIRTDLHSATTMSN